MCLVLFSGFRGTHRPPAPPSDTLEDNVPGHDEADFDIPDTQAVLERFMSNMSKLADDEYRSLSDLLDSLPDPSSYSTVIPLPNPSLLPQREWGVWYQKQMKIPCERSVRLRWSYTSMLPTINRRLRNLSAPSTCIKLIKSADFKVEDGKICIWASRWGSTSMDMLMKY
jgi:hypothetical protein